MKNVRVEQADGISRQLMRHPRQDPLVEQRVAVVIAAQRAWFGHKRPRVDDRQQHAYRRRKPRPVTWNLHTIERAAHSHGKANHPAARLRISVSSISIATALWPPCGMMISA